MFFCLEGIFQHTVTATFSNFSNWFFMDPCAGHRFFIVSDCIKCSHAVLDSAVPAILYRNGGIQRSSLCGFRTLLLYKTKSGQSLSSVSLPSHHFYSPVLLRAKCRLLKSIFASIIFYPLDFGSKTVLRCLKETKPVDFESFWFGLLPFGLLQREGLLNVLHQRKPL